MGNSDACQARRSGRVEMSRKTAENKDNYIGTHEIENFETFYLGIGISRSGLRHLNDFEQ